MADTLNVRTVLWIASLCLALAGCREKPSDSDCQKMAAKRAALFFAGKSGPTMKMAKKMELQASHEECMASWSKKEAICVAGAKNRNQVISCR